MNLLLRLIPLLLMLTLVPAIFASCCKLSAFVLRRRVVGWKQCFGFAFISMLLWFVVNIIVTVGGAAFSPVAGIVLAFIVQIGIGGWFFSHQGTYANGQDFGWRGGAELTALSLVFIAAIGVILLTATSYLRTLA